LVQTVAVVINLKRPNYVKKYGSLKLTSVYFSLQCSHVWTVNDKAADQWSACVKARCP